MAGNDMMYEYTTLADETEVTHSHIIEKNGIKTIEVHFERAKENGFDSARCVLPTYQWKFRDGFTDEEMSFFIEFLQHNSNLLFGFAEQGSISGKKVSPNDNLFHPDNSEEMN